MYEETKQSAADFIILQCFSLWLSDDADEGEAVFDGNSKEVEEIQEEGEDVGK